jgi:hypothetical protein
MDPGIKRTPVRNPRSDLVRTVGTASAGNARCEADCPKFAREALAGSPRWRDDGPRTGNSGAPNDKAMTRR